MLLEEFACTANSIMEIARKENPRVDVVFTNVSFFRVSSISEKRSIGYYIGLLR